ncbi:hypothetical protein YPPY53_2569, partial [Yersinia pestis PY-53]
MARWCGA